MPFAENRLISTKHKFVVHSDLLGFAEFQKMSELSFEAAQIDYWEGGALIPIKDAGRLTFADLTLDRGVSQYFNFHNWALKVADASLDYGGAGLPFPEYKTDDFSILQRDRDNTTMRQWDVIGVFVKKYMAGDWDNTVDEVVIEQLVLGYDYFVPGAATNVLTLVP